MPVYQERGPGIGAGIDQFFQNRMQNAFLRMQQQQAADAHNRTEAEMVANYGYQPATEAPGQSFLGKIHDRMFGAGQAPGTVVQAGVPSGQSPAPVAPPIDHAAFSSAIGNMGQMAPPVASPIPSAPAGRGAVTPPSMLGGSPSMLGPDAFQQNLEQSFGRAGIGAPNIPGSPIARQSAPVAPAGNAAGGDYLSSLENAPRITLSNGASIQPFAGLVRSLRMKQAETQMTTDEDIRKAAATGQIDKNTADAMLARRNANRPQLGDADYAPAMAQVAGAEAAARVPAAIQTATGEAAARLPFDIQKAVAEGRISRENGMALEGVRASVQREMQKNAQDFETKKITQQQQNERDMAAQRMAAEFFNRVGETDYTARGTLTGQILPRPAMPTTAPSSQIMGASTKPPLATRVQQLQSQGVSKDQARAQLQREGYDLSGKTP